MKTFTKLLAATALALTMAAPASAAVYISFDGINDAYFDADDGEINQAFGALGGFSSVLVQGNADPSGAGILHSTAVEVTSANTAASLTVYVTRTGFSSIHNTVFFSSNNNNNANGLTSKIEHFYSLSNQKYGGTLVGSLSKTGLGGNYAEGTVPVDLNSGMFTWTQKYTLTATRGATDRSLSPTALAVAVPEPGTWALMIGGFGGAGAMLRRRRSLAAAA